MTSMSQNIIALRVRQTFTYFSVAQGYRRHVSGVCTGSMLEHSNAARCMESRGLDTTLMNGERKVAL